MQSNINDYLQAELEKFCADFIQDRAAQLRRRGAVATGDLANSLAYEVRAQAVNAGVEALIAFEEHGRFIDMRRLQPAEGGADYIANLISWVERKGLKEKMIRGYMRRRKLKTVPERVMTFLAFGIARKRFNGKYRRTRWYNKSKSAQISELYDEIQASMPDEVLEEIKNAIANSATTAGGGGLTRTKVSKSGRNTLIDYAKAKGRS